jgi:hypothetical protein
LPPRPFFAFACILFGLSLLVVGLWPFNFVETNRVSILPEGKGLRFEGPTNNKTENLGGIALTPLPLTGGKIEGGSSEGVSIEIWLRPATEESHCLKRILDVRNADGGERFFIGQWKSYAVARSFANRLDNHKPYLEIGIGNALSAERTVFLTVTSEHDVSAIYIDGRMVKRFPREYLLDIKETLDGHRLYLGNSPDINCPWGGELFGVAIYERALSSDEVLESFRRWEGDSGPCEQLGQWRALACWRFDSWVGDQTPDLSGSGNDLRVPSQLAFVKPWLHRLSLADLHGFDLVLNITGFIPFGFLVMLWQVQSGRVSMGHCVFISILCGLVVSLGIETAQVWLPGRDSSLADLLANTLGTGVGAGPFVAFRNKFE